MPPSPLSLAELRDVSKTYRSPLWRGGRVAALSGVSMAVEPGEVIGLLGPNRSGKTTVLRLILGLSRPSSGTCWRFGRPASEVETLERVGYVPDRPTFPAEQTPRGMLRLLGRLSGVPSRALTARVDLALAEAGLEAVAARPARSLSRGTIQRLAVAQALLHDPELLLLDEPFSGLDPEGGRWLSERIASWSDEGRAVLLVSHEVGLVRRLATRVVALEEGRARWDGLPSEWIETERGAAAEEVGT